MPKLNLRHNLPLFVALVAVTAAVPLTVFVALTQTQLKSKAGGGPISYASSELRVTEIGTIIKHTGGVGRIKNSVKMALAPQNKGNVLGLATPSAITATPTPLPTMTPPEITYLLETEDGRTYHFNYNPYDNMDQFVNKTVLVAGTMRQDVGTRCFPNDSGGEFCYTVDPLPWWPLPDYLGIDVMNITEVSKTNSSISYSGLLKSSSEANSSLNLFELDTNVLCNTTPCIQPLWSTSPSIPSSGMPFWYNPLLIKSSYTDLSSLLKYQIEVVGDEYNYYQFGMENPPSRLFNAKSVKQLNYTRPDTKLFFREDVFEVPPNTEFQTSILINTGQNTVSSADFQLYFDPSRVQLLSLEPNTNYFQQILKPSNVDNTYGTARIVVGTGPNRTFNGANLQVINIKGRTKNLTGDSWISFSYGTKVAAYDLKYNALISTSPVKIYVPNLIPGDLDNDGDVDIFDYNLMVQNFGSTDCNNIADIEKDCEVDIFDYNTLVQNFGKTTPVIPDPIGNP